jgi:hypothetical protein
MRLRIDDIYPPPRSPRAPISFDTKQVSEIRRRRP